MPRISPTMLNQSVELRPINQGSDQGLALGNRHALVREFEGLRQTGAPPPIPQIMDRRNSGLVERRDGSRSGRIHPEVTSLNEPSAAPLDAWLNEPMTPIHQGEVPPPLPAHQPPVQNEYDIKGCLQKVALLHTLACQLGGGIAGGFIAGPPGVYTGISIGSSLDMGYMIAADLEPPPYENLGCYAMAMCGYASMNAGATAGMAWFLSNGDATITALGAIAGAWSGADTIAALVDCGNYRGQ